MQRKVRAESRVEETAKTSEVTMLSDAEEHKLEVIEDMYVGLDCKTGDQFEKLWLEGKSVQRDWRGVITSLKELKSNEIKRDDGTALDHQARRRGFVTRN